MIPLGRKLGPESDGAPGIIGFVAKQSFHQRAAKHARAIVEIHAAHCFAKVAGHRTGVGALQECAFEYVPAVRRKASLKIGQRQMIVVARPHFPHRPEARHPVGGPDPPSAAGHLVILQPPFSEVERLGGL